MSTSRNSRARLSGLEQGPAHNSPQKEGDKPYDRRDEKQPDASEDE